MRPCLRIVTSGDPDRPPGDAVIGGSGNGHPETTAGRRRSFACEYTAISEHRTNNLDHVFLRMLDARSGTCAILSLTCFFPPTHRTSPGMVGFPSRCCELDSPRLRGLFFSRVIALVRRTSPGNQHQRTAGVCASRDVAAAPRDSSPWRPRQYSRETKSRFTARFVPMRPSLTPQGGVTLLSSVWRP